MGQTMTRTDVLTGILILTLVAGYLVGYGLIRIRVHSYRRSAHC